MEEEEKDKQSTVDPSLVLLQNLLKVLGGKGLYTSNLVIPIERHCTQHGKIS